MVALSLPLTLTGRLEAKNHKYIVHLINYAFKF